jgi:hypothetical protein
MSTPATVPIFDPSGQLRDVPYEQMHSAVQAGGKPGVLFQAPDGSHRYIPADQTQAAAKAGGKILPMKQQEIQHPGFWSALGEDLKGLVKAVPGIVSNAPLAGQLAVPVRGGVGEFTPPGAAQGVQQAASTLQADQQRKAEGKGPVYRAGALAATGVGANVEGMEQSAKAGDVGGVLGHATAAAVPAVAPLAVEGVGAGLKKFGNVVNETRAVAGAAPVKPGQAVQSYRQIPEALSRDSVQTLNKFSQKEGLPELKSETLRDAVDELQQNLLNRSKAKYKVVDDAVGGDLKPVQERMQKLNKAIRENDKVNPELADKQRVQLAEASTTYKELIEKAKQNGVANAEDLMKQGDRDYARSSQGTAGRALANGVKQVSGQVQRGGHPAPGGLASQIDRLTNKGMLKYSLDPETAQELQTVTRKHLEATRAVKAAKDTFEHPTKAPGKILSRALFGETD